MIEEHLQLNHVRSTALFPSRVDNYAVPDCAEFNAALLAAIAARRAAEPGIDSSNQIGWHSERDLFAREEPPFQKLTRYIKGAIGDSIKRYWPDFEAESWIYFLNGWVNINGQGAFNTPHAHGGFHLSGCYYVAVPSSPKGRSGQIEFLNPAGAMTVGEDELSVRMIKPLHRIQPRAGQMLIFPSYLRHWVYPNQEPEDRVTIAFNMRLAERDLQA